MKKRLDRIAAIIQAVSLLDVRLVKASAFARIRHPSELKNGEMAVSHEGSVRSWEKGTLTVAATIDLQISERAVKAEPSVGIHAEFELIYKLPAKTDAARAELEEFAAVNGVFQAWPYSREFIQNTMVRMGLPALILPVFRLRDMEREKPHAGEPEVEAGSVAVTGRREKPATKRPRGPQ